MFIMKKYENKYIELEKINESKTFGEFLANLRNSKGLTQQELAEKLTVTNRAISKWENDSGYPDVSVHKIICDYFGLTYDEFRNGKYDIEGRIKKDKIKRRNKIITIFLSIFIPIFILLLLFFVHTYDSLKVYNILSDSQNLIIEVNGMYVKNNKKEYLYISNIKLKDFEIKDQYYINVSFYENEELFYTYNELSNIVIKCNNIKLYKNNIKIKVTIYNGIEKIYDEKIKIIFDETNEDKYSANKEIYNDKNIPTIEKNLKEDGFIKDSKQDHIWNKETINNNEKENISISSNERKIMYLYEDDKYIINAYYYKSTNSISGTTFTKNKIHILLEKYKYDIKSKKLNCKYGICTSVEKVKKILEKYINLLSVE